jgi:Mg2+/Co2+ transporter CorC
MNTSTVETLMREASFVPESKPVDDLLREMQASATHMVVVVDEYGGIAGVATLEDLIEEIVGEIKDEYDSNSVDIEKLGEYKYRVAAKYSLFELGEEIGLELDDDEVDSVGGLFSKVLGRLPQKGDSVEFAGLELRVERLEARRKRLVTLLVEVTESAQAQLQAMRKIPGKQND